MKITSARIFLFSTILVFAVAACGQKESAEPAAATEVEEAEASTQAAGLPRTASASGAVVFFISPADGDTLANPISVGFGSDGMDVVKAGNDAPHSGHHHLIIDAGLPDLGLPIPASEHYVHFGDGSIDTEINLEPGSHTLQLLLGDYLHIPHDPPLMSDRITVIVE
jgi:Domain of unknown function (DUF4399)